MESERDDLAYDLYDGEDDDIMFEPLCPVVIFHGLFDNKGNWIEIAKEIAEKTVRKVYVLDMRDHGNSPKTSSMDHSNNVRDLENCLRKLGKPTALIGHSIGGTAALDLAFRQPTLVKELILIDVSPLRYPQNDEILAVTAYNILKGFLLNLPINVDLFEAKTILYDVSSLNKMVCSNLYKCEEGWKLKTNFEPIAKLTELKTMRNLYPLRGTFAGRCFLVHSETSGYVNPVDDYGVLKIVFPKIKILCLKNCSHWIHMDKPKELSCSIIQHLNKYDPRDK